MDNLASSGEFWRASASFGGLASSREFSLVFVSFGEFSDIYRVWPSLSEFERFDIYHAFEQI